MSALAAKVTVATFASLTGKPLVLVSGRKCHVVNNVISVPLASEHAYVSVERLLSHIVFQSDSKARDNFVKDFSRKASLAKGPEASTLESGLQALIDVLNSHRVESLWRLIYPGSYAQMRVSLNNQVKKEEPEPHAGILSLFRNLEAECSIPPGLLESYIPGMQEALRAVENRGYEACLVAVRKMFTAWAEQLRQEVGLSKREALGKIVSLLGETSSTMSAHYGDYRLEAKGPPDTKALNLELSEGPELTEFLSKSEKDMQSIMESIRNKLHEHGTSQNSDAIIRRVVPNDSNLGKGSPLSQEDHKSVEDMRKIFSRAMQGKGKSLEDSGVEVDPGGAIERALSGMPLPCFKSEKLRPGFKLVLLIDRSISMKDTGKSEKSRQAERGARMLLKALDLPGVSITVLGFQSFRKGVVELTKFNPKTTTFESDASSPCAGYTPLHIAIREGTRILHEGAEAKHLFVLTDGGPYFIDIQDRVVPSKTLREEVRLSVQYALRCNIHVTGLIIGKEEPPTALNYMFGHHSRWAYLNSSEFADDIVLMVRKRFESFLQRS